MKRDVSGMHGKGRVGKVMRKREKKGRRRKVIQKERR